MLLLSFERGAAQKAYMFRAQDCLEALSSIMFKEVQSKGVTRGHSDKSLGKKVNGKKLKNVAGPRLCEVGLSGTHTRVERKRKLGLPSIHTSERTRQSVESIRCPSTNKSGLLIYMQTE